MKQKKGEPGYLDHQLKVEIIKTLISFALVLAILALGIIQTWNQTESVDSGGDSGGTSGLQTSGRCHYQISLSFHSV